MTLTCPATGGNLAAIAKQLHATALQAETDIAFLEQEMRAAVNLPTVMLVSTAPLTNLPANFDNDIGLLAAWGTSFDNTAGGNGNGSGFFGPPMSGQFTEFLGEGIYEVGLCCTVTPSGAVDNNSPRFFRIEQYRPDPSAVSGEVLIQRSSIMLTETNTGVGVEAAIMGTFRARPLDRFGFFFSHGNTASVITMATGAIVWGYKASDTTLTRVVT